MTTRFFGLDTILTTVVSTNCRFGFLLDDVMKSSVRISSTRFNSPDDSSISVPLLKFEIPPLLLFKFLFLLFVLLLLLLLLLLRTDDLHKTNKYRAIHRKLMKNVWIG